MRARLPDGFVVISVPDRATVIAAAIVAAIVLAVDLPLCSAGVSIGDAAEAQTVPYLLGIAHPTGFPAFVLAGWVVTHVVPFGSVAWRMNAFAAGCVALDAAAIVMMARVAGCDIAAGIAAALAFAFGATVFEGALLANAQPLATTFALFAMLGALLFASSGDRRALVAAGAAAGLGIATHPAALWVVPAIATAMLWQRRTLSLRVVSVALVAFTAPLLLYAYLPLRSAVVETRGLDPAAAAPMGLHGLDWDTNGARTRDGFLDEVFGRSEGAGGSVRAALDPRAFIPALQFWLRLVQLQAIAPTLALAALGIAALAWNDRRAVSVIAAGTLGGVAFAYQYRTDTHIDRYLVFSFAMLAVCAAAASRLASPRIVSRTLRIATPVILLVAAIAAFANERERPVLGTYDDGEAIIDIAQRAVPDGAIVVAQWNDATALAYGAFVEHRLGSRIIIAGWPAQYADQYPRWRRSRRVVLFASSLAMMQPLATLPTRRLPSTPGPYAILEVLPDGPSPR